MSNNIGKLTDLTMIHEPIINLNINYIISSFDNVKYIKYERKNYGNNKHENFKYCINICYSNGNEMDIDDERNWKSLWISNHSRFTALCKNLESVMRHVDPAWIDRIGIRGRLLSG